MVSRLTCVFELKQYFEKLTWRSNELILHPNFPGQCLCSPSTALTMDRKIWSSCSTRRFKWAFVARSFENTWSLGISYPSNTYEPQPYARKSGRLCEVSWISTKIQNLSRTVGYTKNALQHSPVTAFGGWMLELEHRVSLFIIFWGPSIATSKLFRTFKHSQTEKDVTSILCEKRRRYKFPGWARKIEKLNSHQGGYIQQSLLMTFRNGEQQEPISVETEWHRQD